MITRITRPRVTVTPRHSIRSRPNRFGLGNPDTPIKVPDTPNTPKAQYPCRQTVRRRCIVTGKAPNKAAASQAQSQLESLQLHLNWGSLCQEGKPAPTIFTIREKWFDSRLPMPPQQYDPPSPENSEKSSRGCKLHRPPLKENPGPPSGWLGWAVKHSFSQGWVSVKAIRLVSSPF